MMTLHQIIEPRLLATADLSKMQRRRVSLCCPDTLPNMALGYQKHWLQYRILFDSYGVIGENTLALCISHLNRLIEFGFVL